MPELQIQDGSFTWLAIDAGYWQGDQRDCWPGHFAATQRVNAVREVSPGTLTGTAANTWLEQSTASSITASTANAWKDPMTFQGLLLSPV